MPGFNPLVSVIIPAYNSEQFISATLESVLNQTFKNFEILVIDDGSSDSTANIVCKYISLDNRIVLVQQQNAGVAAARNQGIRIARGKFIAPIDSDDIWFPEFLEAQLSLMATPEVGMVFSWSVFLDQTGQLTKTCQSNLWQGEDYLSLVYRNLPGNASCALLRRRYVQMIGGYDQSFRDLNAQGCEDWDLYLRLTQRYEVRVVPRILVGYRQVNGSMSTALEPMQRGVDLILDRFAQQHPEIDPSIYAWNRSNFAWYLALKCSRYGYHQGVLAYMKKAISLDYFPFLRITFYRLGIATVLKIICQPMTTQVWPDHKSWLAFKERWITFIQAINPFYKEITLEKLQKQQLVAQQRFPWKHYEKFLAWRCNYIRQKTQQYQLLQKR